MSGFDLNLLMPLDALLRDRSVSEAARRIGVSQPTMSGMLGRLRDQLHDPLLVRVGRTMELTPRAIELTSEVRQALLGIERVTTMPGEADPATFQRHFKIMASEFGLFLILPAVFRRAIEIAPQATFEVLPIDKPIERVYAGDVDLCLTGDPIAQATGEAAAAVRTQTLLSEVFVGIVDDAHPLRGAITTEQFLSFPHVATQFPGSCWTVEDIGFPGLSETHPPRVRVPSFLAIGRMVAGSQAIGVLPSHLAPLIDADVPLRSVTLPADFARIAVRSLWHNRYDRDPSHRWLRTLVAEVCRSISDGRDLS